MAQREQQRAQEQERVNALSPGQQGVIARQKELGYLDEFGNPLQ